MSNTTASVETILTSLPERTLQQECSLINPVFSCDLEYLKSVIFRAEILGSVKCNCTQALQKLTAWINQGASINIADSFQLLLNPNCDIRVMSSNERVNCRGDLSTDSSNEKWSATNTYIVSGAGGALLVTLLIVMVVFGVLLKRKNRKR